MLGIVVLGCCVRLYRCSYRDPCPRGFRRESRRSGISQCEIGNFDDKVIAMYARGMTVREVLAFLLEMYHVEVSPDFICSVTGVVMSDVTAWQARPLEPIYPLVFFDALRVKILQDAALESMRTLVLGTFSTHWKRLLVTCAVGCHNPSLSLLMTPPIFFSRSINAARLPCASPRVQPITGLRHQREGALRHHIKKGGRSVGRIACAATALSLRYSVAGWRKRLPTRYAGGMQASEACSITRGSICNCGE
jgi:hypothetical protein